MSTEVILAGAKAGLKGIRKLRGKKGRSAGRPRRRRRARLGAREMYELIQIKNILGRTAAANALPFYMSRGG